MAPTADKSNLWSISLYFKGYICCQKYKIWIQWIPLDFCIWSRKNSGSTFDLFEMVLSLKEQHTVLYKLWYFTLLFRCRWMNGHNMICSVVINVACKWKCKCRPHTARTIEQKENALFQKNPCFKGSAFIFCVIHLLHLKPELRRPVLMWWRTKTQEDFLRSKKTVDLDKTKLQKIWFSDTRHTTKKINLPV